MKKNFYLLFYRSSFLLIIIGFLLLFGFCFNLPAKNIATSSHPKAEQHFNKGVAYLLKGQLNAAEKEMKLSLSFDPHNGKIHWETGWVYWQKKDWRNVIHHWEQTKRFTPQQNDLKKFLHLAYEYVKWEKRVQQTPVFKISPQATDQISNSEEIHITAVGDIMLGSDFPSIEKLPPDDGHTLFSNIKSHLKGDVVFGNLEAPLTDQSKTNKCKKGGNCYAFRTPKSYAMHLKSAGFNILNLANNHIVDFGILGVKDTINALENHNVNSFGYISNPSVIIETKGIKIGFLGVSTTYCCIHINEISKSEKIVKSLKEKSDIVVVSFHAGAEGLGAAHTPQGKEYFYGEFRGNVRLFSHRMIEAGADLIIGHGPHTIRGMEYYQNKLIAYSLGNFLGYLGFNTSGHLKYSLILNAVMSKSGQLKKAYIIPVKLTPQVIPEFDPQGNSLVLLNDLSEADFGQSAFLFDDKGYWQP